MNTNMITIPVEEFAAMQERIALMGQQLVTLTNTITQSTQHTQRGGTITLNDFFRSWLAVKEHEVQNTTYEKNLHLYKRISRAFGSYRLIDITRAEVQGFINGMAAQGLSLDTIKHTKGLLSSVLRLAAGDGYIPRNPCTAVTLPRMEKVKKRPATPKEYAKLLAVSKEHRLGFTVPLLFETGIRLGEMLALTWDDVDAKTKTLNIDKQFTTNAGKGQAELKYHTKTEAGKRRVPVNVRLLNLLQEHRESQGFQCKYVIANRAKNYMTQPSSYRKIFNLWKYRAHVGKDITPHTARHYFIANILKSGIAPEVLRQITGHADLTTLLDIYGYDNNELSDKDKQKIVDAIQEFSPMR